MAISTSSTSKPMETRGPAILAVTIALLVSSTVFVVCRLVSRIGIVHRVSWDDYFMIAAWIITFGLSFSICYGTSVGLGRHSVDIPDEWKPALQKAEYTFSVLYNPALMLTKTSILVFYLTLSRSQKAFRWVTIATMVVVILAGTALTLLNIIQCRPFGATFQSPVPRTAKCTDILVLYLSSAPVNIITDLAIFFLPMPILTRMRLPMKQKIILLITFAFGVFVVVVDVVRIAYLQSAAQNRLERKETHRSNDDEDNTIQTGDFPWYAGLSFMWSAIEVNVGIMCACVPALKPLVARFLPHILRNANEVDYTRTYGSMTRGDSPGQPPQNDLQATGPTEKPAQNTLCNPDEPIGMMNFLTTPDMDEHSIQEVHTERINTTNKNVKPTFFDFVGSKQRKSMVEMTASESYFPFIMVTILFLVWGFGYGFLDVLNTQFQAVTGMSESQFIGLHSAYFGGYFIGPLTIGRIVLKRWGFKACFAVGLVIYACGTLIFWPSAVLTSFPAFLISNLIVGFGLSTLEVSANPFIALCGPPEYAEIRLNLSQGLQAIATVVSPLLAKKVLFKAEASSLIDVQWTYLGICFFTIILAIAYYYVPLPEVSDEDLDRLANHSTIPTTTSFRGIRVVYITLGLGLLSQLFYCGGQEAVSTSFQSYLTSIRFTKLSSTDHQAVGHTAFALSRFLAAFAGFFIKPRYILLVSYIGAIGFSIGCMQASSDVSGVLVIFVYFFEGPIFSTLFAMCIRGLGSRTKDASAFLTAAIGGGAIFPPIVYAVTKTHDAQYAYCTMVAAFAAGALLPIYLMLFRPAAQLVDPFKLPEKPSASLPVSRVPTPGSSPKLAPFQGSRERNVDAGSSNRDDSNASGSGSGSTQRSPKVLNSGIAETSSCRDWGDAQQPSSV